MLVDQLIIAVYLMGILVVGIRAGGKMNSLEEYSVASRSYPAWIVFATLSASFIGGGFSTGNAAKVFQFGVLNIVALWGFSLKELLVAKFVVPHVSKFPSAISVGDIMRPAYGKTGQVITGIFSVFLCAGIVGAQVGAMGVVFNVFTGLPPIVGILIGCGIVIAYSTLGGMRAVVVTDVIQFFILAAGIPVALILGIAKIGGWDALQSAIPASHFSLSGGMSMAAFASLFITFIIGETLVPPYVQRMFIGKSAVHTQRGTYYSGFFSIPFFMITGALGLVALALEPSLEANLAMPYVIKEVLPIGLRGLVIAAVISIVMSSADSFLNGASTAFVQDILQPLHKQQIADRKKLNYAKIVNFLTGLLAIVFAITVKGILDILLLAYNFWAPIILFPLLAVLFGWRTSKAAFVGGTVAGIVGTLLWNQWAKEITQFDGMIAGFLCNAIVFMLLARWKK